MTNCRTRKEKEISAGCLRIFPGSLSVWMPGTHGHPCFERKNWRKTPGIPEHFVHCPLMGLIKAGIGILLAKNLSAELPLSA